MFGRDTAAAAREAADTITDIGELRDDARRALSAVETAAHSASIACLVITLIGLVVLAVGFARAAGER